MKAKIITALAAIFYDFVTATELSGNADFKALVYMVRPDFAAPVMIISCSM